MFGVSLGEQHSISSKNQPWDGRRHLFGSQSHRHDRLSSSPRISIRGPHRLWQDDPGPHPGTATRVACGGAGRSLLAAQLAGEAFGAVPYRREDDAGCLPPGLDLRRQLPPYPRSDAPPGRHCPVAVAEAGHYLHNYWKVADAQNPGRTAARRLQAAEQIARGNVIAGDPQRCIDIIRRWRDVLGLTVVSGTFYFGGMPQEMASRNIRRFAAEVMPAFAQAEVRAL
jgi:alkanesulfonate monooxygenase SsuD/methylene tetrahydromethanopterin reductase-like flavin-dependent oxidoreductase (luciferase family)